MPTCGKCKKPAVTFIRYNGTHLCAAHFNRFVEERVAREIRRQCRLGRNETVAVALSGGKDSTVALHLVNRVLAERKYMKIVAITIDEGIRGYRGKTINAAKKNCRLLGVEHHVMRFRDEFGRTLDGMARMKWKKGEFHPCTFCGVLRRFCINKMAREAGATWLVTGLNLDDTAQSALMNICRGDVDKFARMGPHEFRQENLVPRIQPLRTIPEKEVFLYAMLNGIGFDHGECPYAESAARNRFRSLIGELEDQSPGTRHSVLVSAERIAGMARKELGSVRISSCSICGEPTGQKICKACLLMDRIENRRQKIRARQAIQPSDF